MGKKIVKWLKNAEVEKIFSQSKCFIILISVGYFCLLRIHSKLQGLRFWGKEAFSKGSAAWDFQQTRQGRIPCLMVPEQPAKASCTGAVIHLSPLSLTQLQGWVVFCWPTCRPHCSLTPPVPLPQGEKIQQEGPSLLQGAPAMLQEPCCQKSEVPGEAGCSCTHSSVHSRGSGDCRLQLGISHPPGACAEFPNCCAPVLSQIWSPTVRAQRRSCFQQELFCSSLWVLLSFFFLPEGINY